ncbi:U-box domain-containing protein 9, partial [Mucuna pruriens]
MATNNEAYALKEKLRELVNTILDSDDYTVNVADDAILALSALRDMKYNSSLSRKFHDIPVPPHFKCPLSGHLMIEPVILATEQTFDRAFIERWLNEVHRICPQTKQVLSHAILTPNCLVHGMITKWCKEHGVELPKPVWDIYDEQVTDAHRQRLRSLLYKLSLSLSEQKEAAKELRHLAKRMPAFRTLFRNTEVLHLLVSPLLGGTASVDPELHEDLITTLLNLSINEDNKKVFGENEEVLSLLIDSLKSGNLNSRGNAAATIFSLSAIDSNKEVIGKSGAIKYLVDLLEEGHPSVTKDAASALFKLCCVHENKGRTVREGAVQVILNKIIGHFLVDELLALLALLSTHSKAIEALVSHGAVPFLFDILRENASERVDENCVAILCTICFNDRDKRNEIREDEMTNHTLYNLTRTGSSRAKRKANAILERISIPQSSTPNN